MKRIISFLLLLLTYLSWAQVGINTTSPESQLDIRSSNQATPSNTDGLLIPKVDDFPVANPTAAQQGMLVYLTTTSGTNEPGFYYWDDITTTWIPISKDQRAWSINGNSGTNPATHFFGTTDNQDVIFKRFNNLAGQISPNNTSYGNVSFINNTTGINNTAIGAGSLYGNSVGIENTGLGVNALTFNSSGNYNTSSGAYSLNFNTTGSENTATGAYALHSNTTAYYNTAFGTNALRNNTTGTENTAIGAYSLMNNLIGNDNTAIGTSALRSNLGSANTAIGRRAMFNNTNGYSNTAIGTHTLYENIGGIRNTAISNGALSSITFASDNIGVGVLSLYSNTHGFNNIAIGNYALFSNVSGYNVAIGNRSLYYNLSGDYNTVIGHDALTNNVSGSRNSAIGDLALFGNSTGYENSALGTSSLYNCNAGYGNTALGYFALGDIYNGNYNTGIGHYARNWPGTDPSNFIALGYYSGYVGSNSNTIEVGNTSINWIGGQVGFFNYSDGRIKKNVQNNVPGLAFITQLRPVTYNFDLHKQNEIVYKGVEVGEWEGKYDIENQLQTGFIAQEVEAVAQRLGYEFNGVQAPKHEKDLYSVQYASFVVPLVKAVQEQQEIIESQNTKIQSLEERLKVLEEKLSK